MAIKKPTPTTTKDILSTLWEYIKAFFRIVWEVILFIVRMVVKILVGLYLLIKSIAFSVSALIAAFSLLVIAGALSVYLVSIGMGLKDSEAFTSWRENMIETHRMVYEQHQEKWLKKKLSTKEYQVAELSDQSCSMDTDCTTPESYLIRSVCPYTSKCLQNKCAVVCPEPFTGTQR
ncbi:MAG: hypothetical protein AB7J40_01355 [Candidatus Altimarinota bacterium]